MPCEGRTLASHVRIKVKLLLRGNRERKGTPGLRKPPLSCSFQRPVILRHDARDMGNAICRFFPRNLPRYRVPVVHLPRSNSEIKAKVGWGEATAQHSAWCLTKSAEGEAFALLQP